MSNYNPNLDVTETPSAPQKRRSVAARVALVTAGAAVGLLALASCGGGDEAPAPSETVTVTAAPSDPGPSISTPSATTAPTTGNQTPEPSVTPEDTVEVSQEFKNALASAESYLEFSSFSKAGLYDQLTSEYGEGFPEDAAQYAVDNVEADWKAEAVEAAELYYYDMNMSKSGVRDQLVSEYGEQFTEDEADYAIGQLK